MTRRIAITGVVGQIGYALVYRLTSGGLLGDESAELRLLEAPATVKALDGVTMGLLDCTFPQLKGIEVIDDPAVTFDEVNVAMLAGTSSRSTGIECTDLLKASAAIFTAQGRALVASAASDVQVVTTGNLTDTNAPIASRHAGGISASEFTALTRLDRNQIHAQLAAKARRSAADVTNVTIWGNHSTTRYADTLNAHVYGKPTDQWIVGDAWITSDFIPAATRRGAAAIAAWGRLSAVLAASVTIAHIRDRLLGTPGGDWASMAVVNDGSCEVSAGLVSSFPVHCCDGEWEIAQGLPFNASTRSHVNVSADELRSEAEEAKSMDLLPVWDRTRQGRSYDAYLPLLDHRRVAESLPGSLLFVPSQGRLSRTARNEQPVSEPPSPNRPTRTVTSPPEAD